MTKIFFALLCLLVASPQHVMAEDRASPAEKLGPLALYSRCYATITRRRPLPQQRFYDGVRNGSLDPIAACIRVLREAKFNAVAQDPEEAVQVIQTFNDFHRSWFKSDQYLQALPTAELFANTARLMHDPGEPALYITRAVFGDAPFSSILTERSGLIAVRDPGTVETPSPGSGLPPTAYNDTVDPNHVFSWPQQGTGNVIGIRRAVDGPEAAFVIPQPILGWLKPIPLFEHFGGGVIGSSSFLMLNFGRLFENNDGGMKVPRRWSKAILSDLLCRDIPAIRVADASAFAEPQSELPFRRSASCQSCHLSLDNMANTARNLRYWPLMQDAVNFLPSLHMVAHDINSTAYFDSPPDGRIYFRSYDGSLIDRPVQGLQQLGEALADIDDLYVCAANRYFELFTGQRVSLQDLGDPATQALTGNELFLRQQVVAAGLNFRKHGDVFELIRELIDNDTYRMVGMRPIVTVK